MLVLPQESDHSLKTKHLQIFIYNKNYVLNMVAVLKLYKDTAGTSGNSTSTDVSELTPSNVRFKTADDINIDSNNPVPIPSAGSAANNSYVNSLLIKCSTAPSTMVDNFRFYTDGTNFGTGITLNIGDQYPPHTESTEDTSGYRVATGTVGTSGNLMTDVYSTITSVTDIFTYTNGSQLNPGNSNFISETGNEINAVGETTNYFVLQASVASNATPGTKPSETITILYDEI